ncbi:AraC family transcriptional regulator [Poritiphilus flavus]|uniref:Helix-turn-helix domain-containing protein n=1 Tax=Poritiphilus flavus TaxID=2697053 RepID=A0A6L9ECB9_9FLAO|nr:AraC family transcriptional regulator [Poritiphilus flavus]NAS12178.1 helix-turn-helix domain-containing protein [Poritiphilus flavus]
MNYISISLYKKMINHAIHEGMDVDELKDLPISPESMQSLQAVPADHFFELHEILDERLGPGFAIRVGQEMKIEDYGVLGLSWRTCSWAGEIFERSERYFKLLSNTYVFTVEKKGDESHILLHREPHRRGLELSNEATLSATVVVLQAMTETDITPTQVTFKHDPPGNLSSHEAAFNCPVLFNQPKYSITYKTADLETRTAKADISINKFLVERVEEKTRGLEVSTNKVASDVESLIKDALPSGIPSIAQICDHIGMSNRTLTRRLSENGVTFRDLIMRTQKRLAKDLLKNTNRSIAEIAFETGFSEQSAFNRAFKRWTGFSPTEFRKNTQ